MSDESTSSSSTTSSRYTLRHRRDVNEMMIAQVLQSDEYDDLDEIIPSDDEIEADMTTHDDDHTFHDGEDNTYILGDDDNSIEIDSSSCSSSTEKDEVSSTSSHSKKTVKKRKVVDKTMQWTDRLHNIGLPISRFKQLDQPIDCSSLSSFDILKLIITNDIMNAWVSSTNKYCHRKYKYDLNVTVNELWAFIAVHIYMAIDHLPQLRMYWQSEFQHPFITHSFTRDRFILILRSFCITTYINDDVINSPEQCSAQFIDHLNNVFPTLYSPGQNLTFDESMAAYKGHSDIRQYIPSKPHKWGYKIYCLAESNYLLRLGLYTGISDTVSEYGYTYDLVMHFMQGLENKSFILYIDCFFTSPTLVDHLYNMGIAVCGSVLMNRKGMPSDTQLNQSMFKTMHRGQSLHLQNEKMCLAIWKDASVMKVIYNHIQPDTPVTTLKRWTDGGRKIDVHCPQAIKDYFVNARSVDVIGQLHYSYPTGTKRSNSTSRLVWWLIDICMVNAYTLYKISRPNEKQLDFRIKLMHEMVAAYKLDQDAACERVAVRTGLALAKDHYSDVTDTARACKQCFDYKSNRKQTKYICNECQVHLCIGKCFSLYHA